MTSLIELNLIPILIALLIGSLVGWLLVKRVRGAAQGGIRPRNAAQPVAAPPPAPAPAPAPAARPAAAADDDDGDSVLDGEAAAIADIAGEFLDVDVRDEIAAASDAASDAADDLPPDNLQTLKGVGPKLAAKLNDLGITRFTQLAALRQAEIEALDARLEQFRGRIARDRLVEQAGYLARGDTAGFEATFGNLGSGAR